MVIKTTLGANIFVSKLLIHFYFLWKKANFAYKVSMKIGENEVMYGNSMIIDWHKGIMLKKY